MKLKTFLSLIIFLSNHTSFTQISLFKDLNTQEEGSSPANFTELNGKVFFTVKTIDGYTLWKTDGTDTGTVQFSNNLIIVSNQGNQTKNLQRIDNELYYFVSNNISQNQLWKTDGMTETLVLNNLYPINLYFIDNKVCYFQNNGLYKIENQQSVILKNLSSSSYTSSPSPVQLQNQIIFFTLNDSTFGINLQVWKTDGTSSGTSMIRSIDSLIYVPTGNNTYENLSIKIAGQANLILKRLLQKPNGDYHYVIEIWKTDGINTVLIHTIEQNYNYRTQSVNLANFNDKLLFLTYSPTVVGSEVWISDGTSTGTKKLRTLTSSSFDALNNKWGILGNKFYFNDGEMWQSDGTVAGTTFFKDLNPSTNSNPNYFKTISNKLLFKANNDEFWKSDGTEAGTTFVQNIPKPTNSPNSYQAIPEFIYTSNNQLFFSNYDEIHDFELWKSDGTVQNTGLLKNITTSTKGSLGSDKKIKVSNTWYFNGTDINGAELWKTDGTHQGTVMVKNIAQNGYSTVIQQIVSVGNIIYFTAQLTNETYVRLFKSDGTESGTVEIPLNSGVNGINVNPFNLTAASNKLYFMGNHSTGTVIWVSDGTTTGTHTIVNTYIYRSTPTNLIALGDKLLFTSSGLWVSDGIQSNTYRVFGNDSYDVPIAPICLVEFNNKIYFFSEYISASNSSQFKQALWETDGTRTGTKIIKEFAETELITDSYLIFLEKSANRLYFRGEYNANFGSKYFNLWTSDGTMAGTYMLKKIPFNTVISNLKFASVGNQFYLFLNFQNLIDGYTIWTSNGTIVGTNQVYNKKKFAITATGVNFNNKLYFSQFDEASGYELWTTNGTDGGTYLVSEIRAGSKNSQVSNLMNFDDKLLFWGTDGTQGREIWQYLPLQCEGNRNYSLQSGNWDSVNIWSCGTIPSLDDIVIIKSGHVVSIPANYQTAIKGIFNENRSELKILQNAIFTIKP